MPFCTLILCDEQFDSRGMGNAAQIIDQGGEVLESKITMVGTYICKEYYIYGSPEDIYIKINNGYTFNGWFDKNENFLFDNLDVSGYDVFLQGESSVLYLSFTKNISSSFEKQVFLEKIGTDEFYKTNECIKWGCDHASVYIYKLSSGGGILYLGKENSIDYISITEKNSYIPYYKIIEDDYGQSAWKVKYNTYKWVIDGQNVVGTFSENSFNQINTSIKIGNITYYLNSK